MASPSFEGLAAATPCTIACTLYCIIQPLTSVKPDFFSEFPEPREASRTAPPERCSPYGNPQQPTPPNSPLRDNVTHYVMGASHQARTTQAAYRPCSNRIQAARFHSHNTTHPTARLDTRPFVLEIPLLRGLVSRLRVHAWQNAPKLHDT